MHKFTAPVDPGRSSFYISLFHRKNTFCGTVFVRQFVEFRCKGRKNHIHSVKKAYYAAIGTAYGKGIGLAGRGIARHGDKGYFGPGRRRFQSERQLRNGRSGERLRLTRGRPVIILPQQSIPPYQKNTVFISNPVPVGQNKVSITVAASTAGI